MFLQLQFCIVFVRYVTYMFIHYASADLYL